MAAADENDRLYNIACSFYQDHEQEIPVEGRCQLAELLRRSRGVGNPANVQVNAREDFTRAVMKYSPSYGPQNNHNYNNHSITNTPSNNRNNNTFFHNSKNNNDLTNNTHFYNNNKKNKKDINIHNNRMNSIIDNSSKFDLSSLLLTSALAESSPFGSKEEGSMEMEVFHHADLSSESSAIDNNVDNNTNNTNNNNTNNYNSNNPNNNNTNNPYNNITNNPNNNNTNNPNNNNTNNNNNNNSNNPNNNNSILISNNSDTNNNDTINNKNCYRNNNNTLILPVSIATSISTAPIPCNIILTPTQNNHTNTSNKPTIPNNPPTTTPTTILTKQTTILTTPTTILTTPITLSSLFHFNALTTTTATWLPTTTNNPNNTAPNTYKSLQETNHFMNNLNNNNNNINNNNISNHTNKNICIEDKSNASTQNMPLMNSIVSMTTNNNNNNNNNDQNNNKTNDINNNTYDNNNNNNYDNNNNNNNDSLILNVYNGITAHPNRMEDEIKESFMKQIRPMLVKLVTLQYPDDIYQQNKALKKMEDKQMKQLLNNCNVANSHSNNRNNDPPSNINNYPNNNIVGSNIVANNNYDSYSNFNNVSLDNQHVSFDHSELPDLEEACLWTRSCLNEFKQILATDADSMLEIGSGEIVTVRVPTHHMGTTMFWEFASDFYDVGFALYFEWHVPDNDDEDGGGEDGGEAECHLHGDGGDEQAYNEADDLYIELGDHSGSLSSPSKKCSKEHYDKDSDNEDDDDNEDEAVNPVEEVVTLARVSSHEEVQCGCHGYDNLKGVYLFKFDNSFSLLRSKKVYYRVVCTQ